MHEIEGDNSIILISPGTALLHLLYDIESCQDDSLQTKSRMLKNPSTITSSCFSDVATKLARRKDDCLPAATRCRNKAGAQTWKSNRRPAEAKVWPHMQA